MVVHALNPSTWEAEAGGSLSSGQPELQKETLSLKNQNKRKQNNDIKEQTNKWTYGESFQFKP